jgi:hypothetical protein
MLLVLTHRLARTRLPGEIKSPSAPATREE